MNSIKILATSTYLPKNKVINKYFEEKFNLSSKWIEKRTGIKNRYYAKEETIVDLAVNVAKKIISENNIEASTIDGIIVATTSTDKIMPGISFEVQRNLNIAKCMCLDLLAGCSGYINALDIARKYILFDELEKILVIGVERISKYLDFEDKNSSVILGDGAGATLIGKTAKNKIYFSLIESIGENNQILTCNNNEKLYMDGKSIYKFAINKTIQNIEKNLSISQIDKEDIRYFLFHQSNLRIIESICEKLNINKDRTYINLDKIGNTFCASIPIILDCVIKENLIKDGDKIILSGYGGGLNLGSILLEY